LGLAHEIEVSLNAKASPSAWFKDVVNKGSITKPIPIAQTQWRQDIVFLKVLMMKMVAHVKSNAFVSRKIKE